MSGNKVALSVSAGALTGWRDYLELCKPKVVLVMLLTAIVGMLVAPQALTDLARLWWATLGIGLAAGSAATINHVVDRHIDGKMARTHRRPLPQGRVRPQSALIFAAGVGVTGIGVLTWMVNPLTAWLTLASLLGYAVIYTRYLKRATPQNIVIGGVAGAAPPLLGWVAVTGQVTAEPLLLMLIIFVWTPPHFWSLCIARKADYAKAGVPMLPVTHGERYTRLQVLLYSVLLVPCTLLPFLSGMSGVLYVAAVLILNIRFLYWAIRLFRCSDKGDPMRMFIYSIKYIIWFFVALLADYYLSGVLAG